MDIIDSANDLIERERNASIARALANPKPVSSDCEDCGDPVQILSNGAHGRYCGVCAYERRMEYRLCDERLIGGARTLYRLIRKHPIPADWGFLPEARP